MKEILILQLRLSLSLMNELQVQEQNPDKYLTYQRNKERLQKQINELAGTSQEHYHAYQNENHKNTHLRSNLQ